MWKVSGYTSYENVYLCGEKEEKQTTSNRRTLLNQKAFLRREIKVALLLVRKGAWEGAGFSYFLPVEGYQGAVSWKDLDQQTG